MYRIGEAQWNGSKVILHGSNSEPPMSPMGQPLHFRDVRVMSASPDRDQIADIAALRFWAISRSANLRCLRSQLLTVRLHRQVSRGSVMLPFSHAEVPEQSAIWLRIGRRQKRPTIH